MRKLRADFHTHTTYCDGKSTPRQMVEAAYRMGLTDLGISGHADFSMYEPGFGMSDDTLAAYKQELEALREEYAGKLNIYIGIELDTLGPVQQAEYAIGSTHSILKAGQLVTVDDTEEKLVQAVESVSGTVTGMPLHRIILNWRPQCTINSIATGSAILTCSPSSTKAISTLMRTKDAYLEPALAAMKSCMARDSHFEINTGAMSRGYRTRAITRIRFCCGSLSTPWAAAS